MEDIYNRKITIVHDYAVVWRFYAEYRTCVENDSSFFSLKMDFSSHVLSIWRVVCHYSVLRYIFTSCVIPARPNLYYSAGDLLRLTQADLIESRTTKLILVLKLWLEALGGTRPLDQSVFPSSAAVSWHWGLLTAWLTSFLFTRADVSCK